LKAVALDKRQQPQSKSARALAAALPFRDKVLGDIEITGEDGNIATF